MVLNVAPDKISHALQNVNTSNMRFILVSDGSSRQSCITYGWVFGTEEHEILAEHAGAGFGAPTSHRAEGWGMLSGALFIHHLYQFVQIHELPPLDTIPITFLSDNNGLVQRITQRLQYKHCYPNATLTPDWDLVEQISQTIAALPNKHSSVEWVRGHQDESEAELSVEAIYNIRADELAGAFPLDHREQNSACPLLPVEKCRLVLDSAIIQGHYNKAIRETYTLTAYYAYLEQRHGWTNIQRQQVDWISFQRAASNTLYSPVQLLKLVHDKLPTNSEWAKPNPHQSAKCT